MPSLAQSGLKVDLPGGAIRIEGDQRILLVDFDVAQSLGHVAGGYGRWVMHPVVHATDSSRAERSPRRSAPRRALRFRSSPAIR
jgi:hypothetical protein